MESIIDRLENALAAIDRLDDRLHAWVHVDANSARREAERLTAELKAGNIRGPLHGMPIGVKDIIDVRDMPTRAGSTLLSPEPTQCDAPVVAALRKAGAIIIGKTTTVEFACFDPSPAMNPWSKDFSHTPGGSSSGSAVALATGMCEAALGTQTGGSLVRPSTYCGVATCKPTFGRVCRDGVFPVSYHFDHVGPMARSVTVLAALLDCLPPATDFSPPQTVCPESRPGRLECPPRLGVIEPYFMEIASPEVLRLFKETLDRLRSAGAEIVPVPCPIDFSKVLPMHRLIMGAEAAAVHRGRFADHRMSYGPLISRLLDEGLQTKAVDFAAALDRLRAYRRRVVDLFEGVDALIVPATHTTAPHSLATTGTPEFQAPWSCAGTPVAALPCGLSDEGLPAGVQLVGRYHEDFRLLSIAEWCEKIIDFNEKPWILEEQA